MFGSVWFGLVRYDRRADFIGRVSDPNKGIEYLLTALSLLPRDVTLRVLDDPPLESGILRQIGDLKLSDRIHFAGKLPRAELEATLRSASALVMPSLFEGFGLPAVEALAAGTPLVATRAGALAEVVARAGTGTLVPPADPTALAAGISEVLANWEAVQAEAVAARARIEAEFGWRQVAARTVEVYRKAMETRRAPR